MGRCVFLGVSGMGIGVIIWAIDGILKTTDYKTAPEGRWHRLLVLDVATSVDKYVLPTDNAEVVVIDASTVVSEENPLQSAKEIIAARRPRMERSDFPRSGYTGGCPGRVHLQAGVMGSRKHNEACRSRIGACLDNTSEGRARKDRAAQRREDQLAREL